MISRICDYACAEPPYFYFRPIQCDIADVFSDPDFL